MLLRKVCPRIPVSRKATTMPASFRKPWVVFDLMPELDYCGLVSGLLQYDLSLPGKCSVPQTPWLHPAFKRCLPTYDFLYRDCPRELLVQKSPQCGHILLQDRHLTQTHTHLSTDASNYQEAVKLTEKDLHFQKKNPNFLFKNVNFYHW